MPWLGGYSFFFISAHWLFRVTKKSLKFRYMRLFCKQHSMQWMKRANFNKTMWWFWKDNRKNCWTQLTRLISWQKRNRFQAWSQNQSKWRSVLLAASGAWSLGSETPLLLQWLAAYILLYVGEGHTIRRTCEWKGCREKKSYFKKLQGFSL